MTPAQGALKPPGVPPPPSSPRPQTPPPPPRTPPPPPPSGLRPTPPRPSAPKLVEAAAEAAASAAAEAAVAEAAADLDAMLPTTSSLASPTDMADAPRLPRALTLEWLRGRPPAAVTLASSAPPPAPLAEPRPVRSRSESLPPSSLEASSACISETSRGSTPGMRRSVSMAASHSGSMVGGGGRVPRAYFCVCVCVCFPQA
mmetsp:Transcript_12748/g.38247  ORF Transcript_12748/g.38247 Transcript_12748/m.38247 type:complete len:201 (-) Transcript_12748:149-751(-)